MIQLHLLNNSASAISDRELSPRTWLTFTYEREYITSHRTLKSAFISLDLTQAPTYLSGLIPQVSRLLTSFTIFLPCRRIPRQSQNIKLSYPPLFLPAEFDYRSSLYLLSNSRAPHGFNISKTPVLSQGNVCGKVPAYCYGNATQNSKRSIPGGEVGCQLVYQESTNPSFSWQDKVGCSLGAIGQSG